jgi:hypothetical protein
MLVVDWDGTVADIVGAWLRRWNHAHPTAPLTRRVFRAYDPWSCLPPDAARDFADAIADPRLYAESRPVPGALATLSAWVAAGVPLVFLTGTTDPAILAVKRAWLARRAPAVAAATSLHGVPPGHKADWGGSALCDDNPAEWAAWRARHPHGPLATLPWPYTRDAPPDVLRAPWPQLLSWGLALAIRR